MTPSDHTKTSNRRLDTWKEIGAFFGRDERTVKRWEITRGLPVHRVPGGGRANVYANTDEILEWLKGKNVTAEADSIPDSVAGLQVEGVAEASATASSDLPAENGLSLDAGRVERRVGQRRSTERNGEALPAGREARYIAIALAILVALTIIGVARRVSSARGAKKEAVASHLVDPDAKQFYLKGMYYFNKRTPEALNQAVDYFTQAVVRDPQYAEAYVGLADCYNLLREYSAMPPSEAYPRAMAAAKRAIALDDSLSGAHSSLGFVDFYWSRDTAGAQREFERALELDPKSVVAHHWYATFLLHLGEFAKSLDEIEKAQQLDPNSRSVLADKGLILFYAGQKEQAIALLKQLEAAEPDFLSPHTYLTSIYLIQGEYAEYLAEFRKTATLRRDEQHLAVVAAGEDGFARGGSHGMLTAMLEEQQTLNATGQESMYNVARTYALLGRKQEALDDLERSYSKRETELLALKIDPTMSTLRDEPRFRAILSKVGLPVQ